ncbi:proton-coupled zinc antiporter SLC30A9, mitochondrial [Condylostylus longicornis]|uniref:proton-coupled zinc antiporter SLC30A9, mitochondrial n=1 Tax=Condylostylus longicornis TaxID=2530218 RepID=UPI00244E2FED|nr:proton-coupled zinc antiporter SLC30A9, mitochondrial [Condylostylus longicornis]
MLQRSIQVAEILKFRKSILKISNNEISRDFSYYLVKQGVNIKFLNKNLKWRTFSSKNSRDKIEASAVAEEKKVGYSNRELNLDKGPKEKKTETIATKKAQQSSLVSPEFRTKPEPIEADSKTPITKKIEIKTSKGILSVTTTVEDAKINDIILEKTSAKSKSTPIAITQPAAEMAKAGKLASAVPTSKESEKIEKPKETQRLRCDLTRSSLERNFITPTRAISDFLLKASDLESLSKIKRRSPYEQEPPMTVYWRKDVEAKAIEVWGSRENLLRECLKREIERKKFQQNVFTVKRRLRDFRREIGIRASADAVEDLELNGLSGKSGRVVLIATAINATNFVFKVFAWLYTGSHSMFAEAIHSLADTSNQLILAYGIHKSVQSADTEHPYGYSNWRYVSSLISGVGIFCVGTGLSIYHGVQGLMHPEPMQDYFWAFCILGGSLVSEGATLLVAVNEIKRSAAKRGISFKEYVLRGQDPCVNVVLTEDAAAVASVGVAATCMAISTYTGSGVADAVGSLLVGSILGCVAAFIIHTNVSALVGKSIPEDYLNKINSELESDVMIRAIHDVKGVDMGNNLIRYKAEVDFDGRELTRSYLDKQDLGELLKVVKSFQTVEEVEQFLLKHGENIVDLMGGEIDRIEMKLRKKFPELRHCDLEIL